MLITGASGFVGRALCAYLSERHVPVFAAVRRAGSALPAAGERIVGDLAALPDLAAALQGIDSVIHLAGRAHVMREQEADPEAAFQRVNVQATRHLALQAAASGVRRLVFLSSVKVNGERSPGRAFTEADRPAPEDAYGRSKRDAEAVLRRVAAETGLEVAIIRPPLIYGPGVKANLLRLIRLVDRGVPLPFARVDNRRSLIGIRNLCGLIHAVAIHPAAAGETFLASDQQDLSTPALVRALAASLERPARLLPVPVSALRRLGSLTGRTAVVDRLVGSLEVDSTKATRVLGWQPEVSVADGLAETVALYRERGG
jgi:nucleoside-diphosphate-sugar epimerase